MVGLTNMSNQWQKTSPVKRQSRAELKKVNALSSPTGDHRPKTGRSPKGCAQMVGLTNMSNQWQKTSPVKRQSRAELKKVNALSSPTGDHRPKTGRSPKGCAQMVGLTNMSNQWQKTSPVKRQSRAELKKVNALSSPTGDHRPKTGRSPKGCAQMVGLTNMSNQWQKTSPVKRQSRAELKKVNALSSPTGDHRPKTGRSPKGRQDGDTVAPTIHTTRFAPRSPNRIAQLVERSTCKPQIPGSNPTLAALTSPDRAKHKLCVCG
ncbi:hypothetical protein EGW08_023321 [Elysia chlorotica]|uniref:Uncharacterized protein n=1 Tax=Elysia chlorotica TaxID=188477 RepID=A0A3S1AUW2_ELYCH|nr:hypothetical protein EGW08_023321 [Elysia chlorotica]